MRDQNMVGIDLLESKVVAVEQEHSTSLEISDEIGPEPAIDFLKRHWPKIAGLSSATAFGLTIWLVAERLRQSRNDPKDAKILAGIQEEALVEEDLTVLTCDTAAELNVDGQGENEAEIISVAEEMQIALTKDKAKKKKPLGQLLATGLELLVDLYKNAFREMRQVKVTLPEDQDL